MSFVKAPQYGIIHTRAAVANLAVRGERRRSDIVHSQEIQATEHIVKGSTEIKGAGETFLEVALPVVYIDKPTFMFAGELGSLTSPVPGAFPTLSAIVVSWDVITPDLDLYGASLRQHYRGATLAVVTTGVETQMMRLHWTFMGMALTNPTVEHVSVPLSTSGGAIV